MVGASGPIGNGGSGRASGNNYGDNGARGGLPAFGLGGNGRDAGVGVIKNELPGQAVPGLFGTGLNGGLG